MLPRFVPDLNLWFEWHSLRGTLPSKFSGAGLSGICTELGVPAWKPCRAWRRETKDVVIEKSEDNQLKKVVYKLGTAEYTAKWAMGPDGDWWQSEYPVKQTDNLDFVKTLILDEEIVPAPERLSAVSGELGDSGLPSLELPPAPFARLMLEMLGYSEGPIILIEAEEEVRQLLHIAGERYVKQVQKIADSCRGIAGVHYAFSPDNLDASFISPGYFEEFLFNDYRNAADVIHRAGLEMIVHAGGPAGNLLGLIKDTGIDVITGICGSPQGDTSFPEARKRAGSKLVLWGGIAQDFLMPNTAEDAFMAALENTRAEADDRCIIGIADHVPVEAPWERIREAASFFKGGI